MAKIIVVDDDRAVLQSITRILERAGHQVRCGGNGNEGLKLAALEPPDMIISDIIMPEMEGIETIIELRRHWPEIRVLAISGGGRVANRNFLHVAKSLGAHAVLEKPFEQDQLLGKVAQCLAPAG